MSTRRGGVNECGVYTGGQQQAPCTWPRKDTKKATTPPEGEQPGQQQVTAPLLPRPHTSHTSPRQSGSSSPWRPPAPVQLVSSPPLFPPPPPSPHLPHLTSSIWLIVTLASLIACSTGPRHLSRRSLHIDSSLALVRLVSMCFGPSDVAVMKGRLMEDCTTPDSSILAFSAASVSLPGVGQVWGESGGERGCEGNVMVTAEWEALTARPTSLVPPLHAHPPPVTSAAPVCPCSG